MNDQDLARLVLAGYPIWVEVTDARLEVCPPDGPSPSPFPYAEWLEYADENTTEALDIYVEYNGEMYWAGELLSGIGIGPLLRSEDAMREYAYQGARDPFRQWDGFCTECYKFCRRRRVMRSIGGGEWQCPYCDAIEYHPGDLESPTLTTNKQRARRMAELLWGLGLQEQALEYDPRYSPEVN